MKTKMKYLTLMVLGIYLIALLSPLAKSETYLWNDVLINVNQSKVTNHAFYWLEDTSTSGVGKNKDVTLVLWAVIQPLPYNLTSFNPAYNGSIDQCDLTYNIFRNIYDGEGNLINTSVEVINYTFSGTGNVTSNQTRFDLRSRDSVTADLSCHYTDPNFLYIDNVLIGRITTYMSTFECDGCDKYSLEELSQQTEKEQQITLNELAIYDKVQNVITWNFQVWLIASWILKIGLVFVAIGLVFAGAYYFYIFLKNLGAKI
jgi:hypothetical protein